MPEWLLKKDNYKPLKDKDGFINKSIISILGVITRFRLQTGYKKNKFGVNALIKLISAFLLIILVSLTKSFTFVLVANICLLMIINFLNIEEIIYILKVSTVAAIFTFIILLPSIFMNDENNVIILTLKVLVSVTTVNVLACTTQWNELLGTLKVFHVPDMFIFVLDITIKYIIVLGEFSLNMIYSLKLRSVGRSKNKTTALSGIVGTMFIKSKEMAEEMHNAMECRGFTGEYKTYSKFKLKIADYICITVNIIFILTYFYFESYF
ncbi:energy-coupling factor transporter transmembrane component T [Clostridium sp.]